MQAPCDRLQEFICLMSATSMPMFVSNPDRRSIACMAGFMVKMRPQRVVYAASVAAAAAAISALGACYYLLISPALSNSTNPHAIQFPKVPLLRRNLPLLPVCTACTKGQNT